MIAARRVEYLSPVDKALLRAVLYFDIFNYPITAEEACAFAPGYVHHPCEPILDSLVAEKLLFKYGKFYSAQNNVALIERRVNANLLTQKRMKTAERYSQLIAAFPFVKAVLLSGSISKGFMDDESDIDYFIITESKRLWVVRTLLVAFRRVFLFNSRKNFCTNYFIDIQNLSIPDQNIFAATELCTLKPMYGSPVVQKFLDANKWVFNFFPQARLAKMAPEIRSNYIKRFLEKIFSFPAMDTINQRLMRKTFELWKKRYVHTLETKDFGVAFRSTEGVSKSHPKFFQKRALVQLDENVRSFEAQHDVNLSL